MHMDEKQYLIPAFFIITADSPESADEIACDAQDILNREFTKHYSFGFYLDEAISTVEVPFGIDFFSILDIVHITPMSKEEIDDMHQL